MVNFFDKMKVETGVELNDVQKEAVKHTEGALLLLASPGSGKTTTLNMKIGGLLLEQKVKAESIMAVTFSKASALDMSERFDKFFGKMTDEKVHFSTIHSFAFQITREYFNLIGQSYQLIEGDISEEEWKKDYNSLENMPLHKKFILRGLYEQINGEKPTDEEMEGLMTYVSLVKNRMVEEQDLHVVQSADILKPADVYLAYEAFKKKDDTLLVDFDDMLTYCLKALQEESSIREKYQQQYEYVLTDESQDNSIVQHDIIEILAYPQNNICVVADDDQSIFGWRGSDVGKLLRFEEVYPNAKILSMTQNYRSTKSIVNVANLFIKRNKNRYNKEMFTDNVEGQPIQVHKLLRYEDQLKLVLENIKKNDNRKEMAILYRNNFSAITFASELQEAGITFYIKDIDTKFFRHWMVDDILNFMRLSYDTSRLDIFEKIYTKFNGYLNRYHLNQLKRMNNGESVFDNLLTLDMEIYQVKAIKNAKRLIESFKTAQPKRVISQIRNDLGYDKRVKKMADELGFSPDYLMGVLGTLELIANKSDSVEKFAKSLPTLEQSMASSKFNKHQNAVTLSTFHGSKGLEYDTVFMVDLLNGVVPSNNDMEQEKKHPQLMEEAVRLFYVGMTRARKELHLISYSIKQGERVTPSLFLREVEKIMKEKKKILPKKQAVVTLENALRSKDVQHGAVVIHPKFGKGSIVEIENQKVSIMFEKIGLKHLLLDMCLNNGWLQKAK